MRTSFFVTLLGLVTLLLRSFFTFFGVLKFMISKMRWDTSVSSPSSTCEVCDSSLPVAGSGAASAVVSGSDSGIPRSD